jgi:DNA-binding FadR family transcriptional regulator
MSDVNLDRMLSQRELCERLGLDRQTVRTALERGDIPSTVRAGRRVVSEAMLLAYSRPSPAQIEIMRRRQRDARA